MDDAFKKAAEEQMKADLAQNLIIKEQTILPDIASSADRSILLGGILVVSIVIMVGAIGGMMVWQNKNTREAVTRTFETADFEEEVDTSIVPTVTLREEYENPFDESTAYINPFSQDYNPFVLLDEGY